MIFAFNYMATTVSCVTTEIFIIHNILYRRPPPQLCTTFA